MAVSISNWIVFPVFAMLMTLTFQLILNYLFISKVATTSAASVKVLLTEASASPGWCAGMCSMPIASTDSTNTHDNAVILASPSASIAVVEVES